MWITIATAVVVGVCSYTFGIIVGVKLSKILAESEKEIQRNNEEQVKQSTAGEQGYVYALDPQNSDTTYEYPEVPLEGDQSLKLQYMQKVQAIVLLHQLQATRNAVVVFSSEEKFTTYINNPYVTIQALEFLLKLLDKAELFEWSRLTLDRINQLQNEARPGV